MKRKIMGLWEIPFITALCLCVFVSAASLEIDDSVLSQRDYTSGAYTDAWDIDLFTQESETRASQARQEETHQRQALLDELDFSGTEKREDVTEQVLQQTQNLSLFDTTPRYAPLSSAALSGDKSTSPLSSAMVVIIFVALCILSFFAAQGWRQYRKGREEHADNHHPSTEF